MKITIDTEKDSYEIWKKARALVEFDYKTRKVKL